MHFLLKLKFATFKTSGDGMCWVRYPCWTVAERCPRVPTMEYKFLPRAVSNDNGPVNFQWDIFLKPRKLPNNHR